MGSKQSNMRWRLAFAAGFTLTAMVGACADDEPAALIEGLDISAAIQQGGGFQMTLPVEENTSVEVVSAPAGVTASTSSATDPDSVTVALDVAPDAPVGSYVLLLRAERGSEEAEFDWPFEVVPSGAPAEVLEEAGPEALRDQVVSAIIATDGETLQSMWPATAWEQFGAETIESFAAGEAPPCDRPAEDRAHCIVFETDAARALEMTLEVDDAGIWTITSVSLESTN